jgi:hypothetical protein
MTAFELIDAPQPEPSEEPSYMDSCDCKHVGSRLPVLLSIDDGSISIVCATCRRSFLFLDDLAGVSSDEIPMMMAYHDTTIHYPEPEYDGYWQLTPRDEPVEEFAALVDRLGAINPSPAVLDALLDEAAGGGL